MKCPAGSYSIGSVSSCVPCDAGYSSPERSSKCTMCPENTFSVCLLPLKVNLPLKEKAGQGSCIPCGAGTTTPEGSTKCSVNGCLLRSPDGSREFNLSDLGKYIWDYFTFSPLLELSRCMVQRAMVLINITCIHASLFWKALVLD